MQATREITFVLNGNRVSFEVETASTATDLLRIGHGLTGTKEGCGVGECGSCTILVDDVPTLSCLLLAVELSGRHVTTIEATHDARITNMRNAFLEESALQCGFCTPGMIVAASRIDPGSTDDDIRAALVGNVCRCTGYSSIVRAVRRALGPGVTADE